MAKTKYNTDVAPQKMVFLDEKGLELPDPTPVSIPAGYEIPETLEQTMRRLIGGELSRRAAEQGMETFEDSEDFEVDDDSFDPSSPYEEVFDPVLGRGITLEEFHKNREVYEKRYDEAMEKAYTVLDQSETLRAIYKPKMPPTGSGGPPAASPPPAEPSGPKAVDEVPGKE